VLRTTFASAVEGELHHGVPLRFNFRKAKFGESVKTVIVLSFLGAFSKLRKAAICFVLSVRLSLRPHGTTRFPLDGFS
jgi:hypothetical protein